MNGRGSGYVEWSSDTCASFMASSRLDCVFGVVRLISSARMMLVNSGPGLNTNSLVFGSHTETPSTSDGSMSEVNWIRWKPAPMERASAAASVVLPTPGTSSINRWPRAISPTTARRTPSGLPTRARATCSSSRRTSESAAAISFDITLARVRRLPPRALDLWANMTSTPMDSGGTSPRWPNDARSACAFTFDLDAESLWMARGVTEPVALSQGRFGPIEAVPRILSLLAAQGVRASFFVPAWVAGTYPDVVKRIACEGHEIGCHGDEHERVSDLPPEREEQILLKSLEVLTPLAGRRPVGYRAPAWQLSTHTLDLLARHGFEYSSNMMDRLSPYLHPSS